MTEANASRWLHPVPNRPTPDVRLFCLPYAGGSTRIFRPWLAKLPSQIELCAIQLPGRESRLRERPFSDAILLANAITNIIAPYLNAPYVLFGHSMGALISFEVARRIRALRLRPPLKLIVSGAPAPDRRASTYRTSSMTNFNVASRLKELGGTPPAVLNDPELLQLLFPLFCADFSVTDSYLYEPQAPLSCSITALCGRDDPTVDSARAEAWKEQTIKRFCLRMLAGNHFFIDENRQEFLAALLVELKETIGTIQSR